jgi:signal transduction histidine kinase
MRKVLIVFIAFCFLAGTAFAAERGSAKEAVALVNKAVAYYQANGKEAAFKAFNQKPGPFVDRDLYIFVIDWNGVILAHGANKGMINKPTGDLRDSDGKLFMREMVKTAQTKGTGWVDYKWTNPVLKKVENKSSYVQRVGDLLIGCGIYKQ